MSDKITPEAPKKTRKIVKLVGIAACVLLLVGGGVAGGMYATRSGRADAAEPAGPRLVPKSEQKQVVPDAGSDAAAATGGQVTPEGHGGEKFASNYFAMEKEFTSNLRDSVHFVQVGVAVSTPYDETVIQHLKTNDIAVRSAILMALGDTTEEQVFTSEGKRQLQKRLAAAINQTLQQKEGFGGIGNVYFTSFVVQ